MGKGNFSLTRTSETMEELGMSCVALKDYESATFNGFTKRLRPKANTKIVPEYAGYFFRSPKFREVTAMSSLSTRASLNNEMLGRLKMVLPSLEKQAAIGFILKGFDVKIELNCQMNRTLEAMARAIFKSWFVDFLPVRAKMAAANKTPYVSTLPAAEKGKWFVYAIECYDGSIYIGQTEDLRQRWQQHSSGKGGRWTKGHPPDRVVHWELLPSRQETIEREKWLKTGYGRKWLKHTIEAASARTQTGDPVRAKAEGSDPLSACGHAQAGGLPDEIAALFPDSFQDSDVGEIPKRWEIKPIGEAVRCVGGSTPSTKNPAFWNGGTNPFVTPKDMSSLTSPVILDTARHITDAGVDKISSGRLPAGTVLLFTRAPIGYLAITEVPVSVNQGIIAMICDKSLPNHQVLYWTEANMDTIKSNAGGTTFAEISKRNFRPIQVIVLHERVLEAYFQQVEPLHQQVVLNLQESHTLASLRNTLLPKLISGELRVPDAEKMLEDVI